MAASLYGLGNSAMNDFSLLAEPQKKTAQDVQKAFESSVQARIRNTQRTPAAYTAATMPNMLAQWGTDAALQQSQTSAGLLNYNQQLQNMIDESHRTPHGFAENMAQYLPLLGAGLQMSPYLFGTEMFKGNQGGLFGAAGRGMSWLGNQYNNYANPYGNYGNGADYGPMRTDFIGSSPYAYDPYLSAPMYADYDFGGYEMPTDWFSGAGFDLGY